MLDATFWVTFLWNVSVLLFYLGTFTCVLNWIWSCKGNQISSNQISSSDVSYFIAKSNVPSFLPSLFLSVVVADCSKCSSVDVPFPLHRYKACLACFYHGRMCVECCSLTVVSCQVQEIWTLLTSLFGWYRFSFTLCWRLYLFSVIPTSTRASGLASQSVHCRFEGVRGEGAFLYDFSIVWLTSPDRWELLNIQDDAALIKQPFFKMTSSTTEPFIAVFLSD